MTTSPPLSLAPFSPSLAETVFLVLKCIRNRDVRGATSLCEFAAAAGMNASLIELCKAELLQECGDLEGALELVNLSLERAADDLLALEMKARILWELSQNEPSAALLQRIVERSPDYPGAHAALAAALMPGPPYPSVLQEIHRILRPDTYLEIGFAEGATLKLAAAARVPVGVDPDRSSLKSHPPHARLYYLESDAFFREQTLASAFGGRRVDLAFIDGMHLFEYALRDFCNSERWASPDGTIVIHDCLPVSVVSSQRVRASHFWVGDTWKVLDALLAHRPDLRIRVVPTAPSGLVIIRNLDPDSTVLADRMDSILTAYQHRTCPQPQDWPSRYELVSNDPSGLATALDRADPTARGSLATRPRPGTAIGSPGR